MSFCILYNIVSENYSEQYPAVWRGGSSYLNFHYHRIFILVLTSLFYVQTSFEVNVTSVKSRVRVYAPN